MNNYPSSSSSNPLLDWWSAAVSQNVSQSLPPNQPEPLNLTRTLRTNPQTARNLGINRCRLGPEYHYLGQCQALCDSCRGINVKSLLSPKSYLHSRDMNKLNFDVDDPSRHCVLCSAFSWGIERAVESKGQRKKFWKRSSQALRCKLVDSVTKSSKIELSNHVLDALGYKYDIQFGVYCDEGERVVAYLVALALLMVPSQVIPLRSLVSKPERS